MRALCADDTPALYHVSLVTGDVDGGDASSLYEDPELLGHLWLGAYLALEPELVRVVEGDSSLPAGFVVAALDSVRFEQRCETDWWPALREQYRSPYANALPWSLDEQAIAAFHRPERTEVLLASEYPSHLHIALLPEAQGHGWGRALIEWVCDELARRGSAGVHLGVDTGNSKAIGFYRHLGFTEVEGYEGGVVFGRRF